MPAHPTAIDLVIERIIDPLTAVHPNTPVASALKMALSRGAWAIPVIQGGVQIGSIDVVTLDSLAEEQGALCVGEVLDEPLPEVDERASAAQVAELLATHPAVVVTRVGFPLGLLTTEDLDARPHLGRPEVHRPGA
jgi:predicted transcriptional regulator